MWHKIWNDCGRPKTGFIFECYKNTKKRFRRICRFAFSKKQNRQYEVIDALWKSKRTGEFWNVIRKYRKYNSGYQDVVDMKNFVQYYKTKFSENNVDKNKHVIESRHIVQDRYNQIECPTEEIVTEEQVRKHILSLRKNCSTGIDGISSEHLQYGIDTGVIIHLCKLLTICLRYGVVPNSFCKGLLIPLLKKPTLDPAVIKNYRPVIISTVFSKIAEKYIMEQCRGHAFSDMQYGFVEHRGTAMAASLLEDVSNHCSERGSPVFICSLDAEGAFDGLPHSILLQKAIGVIPDTSWRLLYKWYDEQRILVKLRHRISKEEVRVKIGTRQGGLTSAFLFNLFYQQMVDDLSNQPGGITINDISYNVFCYADDICLVSLTVTGLQMLIDNAVKYVTSHGLRFNPMKTSCLIKGGCPFADNPIWYIGENRLRVEDQIDYLGVAISSKSSNIHVEKRLRACRRAFYSLQGAGLCKNGVQPNIISEIWTKACQPVLAYGCECIQLNNRNRSELDKLQAKLLKASLDLSKTVRTTKLLDALYVPKVSDIVDNHMLGLIRNVFANNSRARLFYSYQIQLKINGAKGTGLAYRAMNVCDKRGISFIKYVFNDRYAALCKRNFKIKMFSKPGSDGVVDTVRVLLADYCDKNKLLLRNVIKAF